MSNRKGYAKIDYSKTGRCFIGHLYVHTDDPINEVISRLENTRNIKFFKWSLERGKEGNLHYQFFLKTFKSVKATGIWKEFGKVKGEFFEVCRNENACSNYVQKDDTHISGPYEWEKGVSGGGRCAPNTPPREIQWIEGVNDKAFIQQCLKKKYDEIQMWSQFIERRR